MTGTRTSPQLLLSVAIVALAVLLSLRRHPHTVNAPRAVSSPPRLHRSAWARDASSSFELLGEVVARGKIRFAETVFVRDASRCDAHATDSRGRLWALGDDANASPRLVAHVGGTLLGAAFDSDGAIYAADCTRGLLRVRDGVEIVASLAPSRLRLAEDEAALDEAEIRYCNDVAVDGRTGLVYFTDSSRIAPAVGTDRRADTFQSYTSSHITGDATGRLLVYDAKSGETGVIVTGIPFANGVGVSKDGQFIMFASSSGYTIRKVRALKNAPFPVPVRYEDTELFYKELLPGIPDGLTVDNIDGSVWVPVFGPVSPMVRFVDRAPAWMRRALVSLPPQWRPKSNSVYTMIAQFDSEGNLLRVLHDTKRQYGLLTSVARCADYLYCGALKGDFVVRFDITK